MRCALASLFLLSLCAVASGQPPAVGTEFQVNTTTTSSQFRPAVAAGPAGDFVVAWIDSQDDVVRVQRYDKDGAVGGEFQANASPAVSLDSISVGQRDSGDFMVVWSEFPYVRGRRFASNGTAQGVELDLSLGTEPALAMAPDGTFVIAWVISSDIRARRFDSTGAAQGVELDVNTYTSGSQTEPDVAMAPGGGFVVVWASPGSDGSDGEGFSVQRRRFDADDNPLGSDLQVNVTTTGNQLDPVVAADDSGRFAVVWRSDASTGDDSDYSIQRRLFAADGSALGGELQVNTYTFSYQENPSVAALGDAGFVVVWDSYGWPTENGLGVAGQLLRNDGSPAGGEFQVNTYTTNTQGSVAVAADAKGDFVVVWASRGSSGSDDSEYSVQGQRFFGLSIFSDGFESGNTSAWSSTAG